MPTEDAKKSRKLKIVKMEAFILKISVWERSVGLSELLRD